MSSSLVLQPRLRLTDNHGHGFGPGKAELLRAILATGSIRSAAAQMGMSYNRAWLLVRSMNTLFRDKLVLAARGGGTGGGAELTLVGKEVLKHYTRMERACLVATRTDYRQLRRLMRKQGAH